MKIECARNFHSRRSWNATQVFWNETCLIYSKVSLYKIHFRSISSPWSFASYIFIITFLQMVLYFIIYIYRYPITIIIFVFNNITLNHLCDKIYRYTQRLPVQPYKFLSPSSSSMFLLHRLLQNLTYVTYSSR